jgi:hypothetical protein
MENLMARQRTHRHAPSEAERATSYLIVGLLLAITTPFLVPAGIGAVWIGVSLVRAGHRWHGAAVLAVAAVALGVVVAGILR